jgi:hypothetical protein
MRIRPSPASTGAAVDEPQPAISPEAIRIIRGVGWPYVAGNTIVNLLPVPWKWLGIVSLLGLIPVFFDIPWRKRQAEEERK